MNREQPDYQQPLINPTPLVTNAHEAENEPGPQPLEWVLDNSSQLDNNERMPEANDYLKLKANAIGERIDAHLKRFAADPAINAARPMANGMMIEPYFDPSAYGEGRFVYLRYKLNQGFGHISRVEAAGYLAWLDAGNVGTHREVKS